VKTILMLLFLTVGLFAAQCPFTGLWQSQEVTSVGSTVMMGNGASINSGGGRGIVYIKVDSACAYEYQYMGMALGADVGSAMASMFSGKFHSNAGSPYRMYISKCGADGKESCQGVGLSSNLVEPNEKGFKLSGLQYELVAPEKQDAVLKAMAEGPARAASLKVFFWVMIAAVLGVSALLAFS